MYWNVEEMQINAIKLFYDAWPFSCHRVYRPSPLNFLDQTLLPRLSHRLSLAGPDGAGENHADGTDDSAYVHIFIEGIRVRPPDGLQLLNGEVLWVVLDRGQLPRVNDAYEMTCQNSRRGGNTQTTTQDADLG